MTFNKYLFAVCIILFGCDKNIDQKPEKNIDITGWHLQNKFPDTIIKSIEFIPLETRKDVLLSTIRKVITTDKRIYILDNRKNINIFIFNSEGKYLYSIGSYGRGPGEMITLEDFVVDEKNNLLYALDASSRKVLLYNLETANFISDFKIDFLAIEFEKIDDRHLVFNVLTPFKEQKEYAIAIMDLRSKAYNWYIEKDDYYNSVSSGYSITQSDKTYFVPFFKDIIYMVDQNGVYPYIQFNFGASKFPSNLIKESRYNDDLLRNLFLHNDDWIFGITNFIENKHIMTFNIKYKGSSYMVIYSKSSDRILYGNGFENGFNSLQYFTAKDNVFVGAINADYFYISSKGKFVNHPDTLFKKKYFKILNSIDNSSNPILIKIEFKPF